VLPGIGKSEFDWIDTYGKVALTCKPARFEQYSKALGKWYSIFAFSTRKGYFTAIFNDITTLKNRQEQLSAIFSLSSHVLLGRKFEDTVKAVFEKARELTGAQTGYVALLNKEGDDDGLFCSGEELEEQTVVPQLPAQMKEMRFEVYRS